MPRLLGDDCAGAAGIMFSGASLLLLLLLGIILENQVDILLASVGPLVDGDGVAAPG